MKRFLSTLRLDVVVQFRQGFYYATIVIVVMWAAILTVLSSSLSASTGSSPGVQHTPSEFIRGMYPAVMFGNMVITTFMFVGGLVLLEKAQRVHEGLVVSPLRVDEYLWSKVGSLTFLVIIESLLITGYAWFLNLFESLNPFWVVLGLAQGAIALTLAGFVMVIRYNSLNEFLLPASMVTGILEVPAIRFLGVDDHFLFYLLPSYGPLLLLERAQHSLEIWKLVYAFVYPTIWIAICLFWGRSGFRKFIRV
ncbi:MAG: hypothetical protein ACFCD0_29095 [Gemmataceae bacterium]